MQFIKSLLLPFWKGLLMLKWQYNWYWPNVRNFVQHRILLSGKKPVCYQYTMITGSGKISIGNNCVLGTKLGGRHRNGSIELQARYDNARIELGDGVMFNNNVFLCAANHIRVGNDSLIGEGVTLMDHEAHQLDPARRLEIGVVGEIVLGSNVWVGNNVIILKNSFIGDNTVIAAGAVVSGSFPANVIIGGIPAKVIRDL